MLGKLHQEVGEFGHHVLVFLAFQALVLYVCVCVCVCVHGCAEGEGRGGIVLKYNSQNVL